MVKVDSPQQPRTVPGAAPVEIDILGTKAVVEASATAAVERELAYAEHRFTPGGSTGCQASKQTATLAVRYDDGCAMIPAGLVPRVVACLERLGQRVCVNDRRRAGRPQPINYRLRDQVHEAERPLLDAVAGNRQGQIVVRGEKDRLRAISRIASTFPWAKLLILAATKREVRDLHRKLQHPFRYRLGVQTGSGRTSRFDRVVATMASGAVYDASRWDVVIYPFAEQLAGKRAFEAAMQCGAPRVYGVVEAEKTLPRRTQLIVEGVCGPLIYEAPDPRGWQASVQVAAVEAPWMPEPGKQTALERKQSCYWRNDARNARIAEVAEALAAGDLDVLVKHGVAEPGAAVAALRRDRPCRVAVVVESPQHGRALLRRLRGWRLLDATQQQPHPDVPLDRAILTVVRADRQRKFDVDALVWAAGGRSLPQWRGFPPRSQDTQPGDVLLVDLIDDFDARAVAETASRMQSYEDRRWLLHAPKWATCPGSHKSIHENRI